MRLNEIELTLEQQLAQQALTNHLRKMMAAEGSLSFDRFMNEVLYAPQLGYYARGQNIFGNKGDFVTAPLLTPLFAQTLARSLIPALDEYAPHIFEIGAGSGQLAFELLSNLSEIPLRYTIVERSAALKTQQQNLLQSHFDSKVLQRVSWCDSLPHGFTGIVLGNEILDALPVKRLRYRAGRWYELHVCATPTGFAWQEFATPLSLPITDPVEGYTSELHLDAQQRLLDFYQRCEKGLFCWLDYGYELGEYYHPERIEGTLTCFYQHHRHADPLHLIGLQDITSHLDFTTLMLVLLEQGAQLVDFQTQAQFFIQHGILENAQQHFSQHSTASRSGIEMRRALHTLLAPHEMGELIKVWRYRK